MRQIIFRGYSLQYESWFFGNGVTTLVGLNGKKDIYITDYFGSYRVEEKSVGQFTGKYDKNGTKIFEGDIIRYDNNYETSIHEIMFEDYQFIADSFYESYQDVPHNFFSEDANEYSEVINNTYEVLLLKEEEENK